MDGYTVYNQKMNAHFQDFYPTSQVASILALILVGVDNDQILCF